jgi:hypothetical protein
MPKRQANPNKSSTIAFRVDPSIMTAIDAECERLGVSRGELVRAIVIVHYDIRPANLLERLQSLDASIKRIAKNQVRSLVTLLTRNGAVSFEEAKEIIRKNLQS